ncbi:phosphate uptake regulator PhoU [Candidatus Woesearchaeota archaeon]|nr:MAG: phosphate uptake regulator PhoU [Candidatus Woesearchaeota archaeon]
MGLRKLQLIAGKTYTVSVPKQWASRHGLRASDEVHVVEQDDGSLVVSPEQVRESMPTQFTLSIDKTTRSVDEALVALYYLGAHTITMHASGEFTKELKARIRRTVTLLTGMEIAYEDRNELRIVVLLDESRVDVHQALYRISLLIEQSLASFDAVEPHELTMNEDETDRLYHLAVKVLSRSIENSTILSSAGVKNLYIIPSYLLIAKKLENIMDAAYDAGMLLHERRARLSLPDFVDYVKETLEASLRHLIKHKKLPYKKTRRRVYESHLRSIHRLKDRQLAMYLGLILRYLRDIEEAVFTVSFSRRMRETVKKG